MCRCPQLWIGQESPRLQEPSAESLACKTLSGGNTDLLTLASEERAQPHQPASAARSCASRRWFLPSQNRTSIRCLGPRKGPSQKIESVFSASPETIRREPLECDL